MFRFNMAVMNVQTQEWMYEAQRPRQRAVGEFCSGALGKSLSRYKVLDCFDSIVHSIAQSQRLQELTPKLPEPVAADSSPACFRVQFCAIWQVECDVVTLRIAKASGDVKFKNFRVACRVDPGFFSSPSGLVPGRDALVPSCLISEGSAWPSALTLELLPSSRRIGAPTMRWPGTGFGKRWSGF